ncbi:hypothetical protein SEMRO_91_G047890.1 [Seminavis robusta]|uniref:Uncharacterized protein n=1 Tax=Seminavis robusta TaxID=568900 RepID=A0A9N8DHD7_9STRA|nr:hypothetical protein SEMRO_91_G047890.1 [Seminavis robusta]|eukprot:Sro91_g047890.1 n/a (139) ;mRNA; r:112626-113042
MSENNQVFLSGWIAADDAALIHEALHGAGYLIHQTGNVVTISRPPTPTIQDTSQEDGGDDASAESSKTPSVLEHVDSLHLEEDLSTDDDEKDIVQELQNCEITKPKTSRRAWKSRRAVPQSPPESPVDNFIESQDVFW